MDNALNWLYGRAPEDRSGGLGASSPTIARWLGDIRSYFPSSVVRVMQQDVVEKIFSVQVRHEQDVQQIEQQQRQQRMMMSHGGETVSSEPQTVKRDVTKVGRNDACPCGSGKKYKRCHGK